MNIYHEAWLPGQMAEVLWDLSPNQGVDQRTCHFASQL